MESKMHGTPRHRFNQIALGPFERRVLPWMAKRLPVWITPDKLTIVGVFAGLLIAASYMLTHYHLSWLWLANFGLLLNWWADSLDGTVARVRHIERPKYGFFIDHYCDAFTNAVICLGMGLSPIMDIRVALALIIGYYALTILVCLISMTRGLFMISFAGIGPTEVRLIIILVNILIWAFENPTLVILGESFSLFSLIGIVVASLFAIYYLVFGSLELRKLAKIDPPKSPSNQEKYYNNTEE